jgi:hypothetical protein
MFDEQDQRLDGYRVDAAGELLAFTTSGNVKNIILGALELTGNLDVDALQKAVSRVVRDMPHFAMGLRETREKGKYYLRWDQRRLFEVPLIRTHLTGDSTRKTSGLEMLLEHLQPYLNSDRDLFRQPPCEVHVVSIGEKRHILAAIMSHVAGDAMALVHIVRHFMVAYHEIVTASTPELMDYQMSASTSNKRELRRQGTVLRDYLVTCRHAFVPYKKCSLPIGTGSPQDQVEHHAKRILSQETTQDLVKRAGALRIALVDYLLASAVQAVSLWNDERGARTSLITAALTVNLNGRFQRNRGLNNDSVIYFECTDDETLEFGMLGRQICRRRIRQFRQHLDVKYAQGMEKLNNALRFLPFSLRKRPYRWLLQRHRTSLALGFFGVLWPRTNGRSITGESYLLSAGGLEITEVHGMAYKLLSRTPLYFSTYIYRQQLNLILSAAGCQFTKAESEDFLSLVVRILCSRERP